MNERQFTLYDDVIKNTWCTPTEIPSRGMQIWLKRGRYKIIGDMRIQHITPHFDEATLINFYTPRQTFDINIYHTPRRRKSKPFILIPSYQWSSYCWRVPVTIHDNK